MFEPGLAALDVYLDLLEEGLIFGEFCEARIRRAPNLISPPYRPRSAPRRAHRSWAAQMYTAKCLELDWLQYLRHEASRKCSTTPRS
jgi:hypothetical protein